MQANKYTRSAAKNGLVMLMLYSMMANAAYVVIDDDLMPTVEAQPAFSHYEVPFSKGTATLSNAGRAVLNMTLSQMRGQTVRIIGRPDAVPSKKMELAHLAEDRSNSVRKYLIQEGIKSDDIIIDDDETPNPQKNGNSYPIDLYVSHAANTQPAPVIARVQPMPLLSVKKIAPTAKIETFKAQQLPMTAPQPVPAAVPVSAQVAARPLATPILQMADKNKVEGSFKVTKNEAAIKPQIIELVPIKTNTPASYDFSTRTEFNAEARANIETLAANAKDITVIADGSMAGYKRAKEISTYINKITGTLPEIKTTGAPKGLVTVKG